MNNQNKQPQLPNIEEQVADFIRNTSVSELQKIADDTDTKFIKGTDGREFQANVIRGDEGVVIVPAEAGNSGSVLRAKLLKKIYTEETITLLPNVTIGNSKAVNLQSKVNPLDAMNEKLL